MDNPIVRCGWCEKDDLYRKYHDEEWGEIVKNDEIFFEFLVLEAFQAGLSWHTILKRREEFRLAFDDFDYKKIATYQNDKVSELLNNPRIIRNKLKILATITNAQKFMSIQQEFSSFSNYIWSFVDGNPIVNQPKELSDVLANTELTDSIAKDLKKRGFKFLGSTVVYSFLQATGIINDHLQSCWKSQKIAKK